MQLAHALDHGLVGLLVARVVERGVLLRELVQPDAHLLEVALRLGLDRDLDDGVRELHPLEHDRVLLVAERLAGHDVLEPADRDDVPGARGLDVLARVGVHLEQPPDALLAALVRVEHVGAGLDRARVDAHEGQGADELVGHDLEGEAREGLVVAGVAGQRHLGLVGVGAVDGREVERRGEVGDDGVEQGLHALVLERGPAEHGDEAPRQRPLADQRLERCLVRRVELALEVLLHRGVVALDRGLDEHLAVLRSLGLGGKKGGVGLVLAVGVSEREGEEKGEFFPFSSCDLDRPRTRGKKRERKFGKRKNSSPPSSPPRSP